MTICCSCLFSSYGIFQLTSSQGGWLVAYNMDRIRSSFQLTSSQGGWLYSLYFFITSINLSTHILTRRMTGLPQTDGNCIFLSTHILTRRMTVSSPEQPRKRTFQLTSSQGGWRDLRIYIRSLKSLSTHILTRRMTEKRANNSYICNLSTHILTRRMTPPWKIFTSSGIFQLTSSQGGWRVHLKQ